MFNLKKNRKNNKRDNADENLKLSKSIDKNIKNFKDYIGDNSDVVFRPVTIFSKKHIKGCLIYINDWVDTDKINENSLKYSLIPIEDISLDGFMNHFPISSISESKEFKDVISNIFKGKIVFFLDGYSNCFLFELISNQYRSISDPNAEKTLQSSREGFVENIDTNIFLIRRRLKDSNLVAENHTVGVRTKTKISILYLKDIVNINVLEELKRRLRKIDVDGIIASGVLEQYIEDSPTSIFPQIQNTERPDRAVPSLLEGRICVLTEGTPTVLILPALLTHFISASEDYNQRMYLGSFNRLIRIAALFITLFLPASYISLVGFHPELIPYNLIIPLAKARSELPFPPLLEALIIELSVEFLREMGIRMPSPIAQSLGVIGGIVLGDAAIKANLVSPTMLIVVGITTVVSFTLPSLNMIFSLRLARFPIMILAGMFGGFGLAISWLLLIGHLMKLESFTIPYLSPYAPTRYSDLKDSFIRTFIWKMKYRPRFLQVQNNKRKDMDE